MAELSTLSSAGFTSLSQQVIGFITTFTPTKPTGIPAVFLTERNDKVILTHTT